MIVNNLLISLIYLILLNIINALLKKKLLKLKLHLLHTDYTYEID